MYSASHPRALIDRRRPLRIGGLTALAMVALPVILHGGLDPRRFAAWGAVCIAFAVAFWISVASARLAWLALEAVLVLGVVLPLFRGFVGGLLGFFSLPIARPRSLRA